MEAIELLLGRTSAPRLTAPAPSDTELDVMFQSAVRAPDHGRLRPWHFVVIPSEMRGHFGEVMARAMQRRDPAATADSLQREHEKAFRAPLIVVAAARIHKDHKIPEKEQFASAAAATQNIMLVAHAQGYGAIWKTGAPAYDEGVKRDLGLDQSDEIVGFLYIGTRADGAPALPRPEAASYVSNWAGPG